MSKTKWEFWGLTNIWLSSMSFIMSLQNRKGPKKIKTATAEVWIPSQELEVGPQSGLSLLVQIEAKKNKKLDGVAPLVTYPSPNSFTTFQKKKKNCDTWHVTHNMWHVTHDRWGRWTFSQNLSSLAPMIWEGWCFEDISPLC